MTPVKATKKDANATRENILRTANQLVLKEGVSKLTLDAIALAAGVSKGGLLYHFPSKEALVVGMLEQLTNDFSSGVTQSTENDEMPKAPGKWLRNYIRATFEADPAVNEISAGLLAAIATNPSLLEPVQDSMASWQNQAETDGIDPVLATIIRLATDGLWISELFGLAPIEKTRREEVITRLIEMTHGSENFHA